MSRASQNACGARGAGCSSVASGGMTGCASGGLGNFGATGGPGRDEATTTATAAATAVTITVTPMIVRGLRPLIVPPTVSHLQRRIKDQLLDPCLHYGLRELCQGGVKCPCATEP